MHCPKCFNDCMKMSSRGVVHIIINGMQMDTGRFLFNLSKESEEEVRENFKAKLEEFFKWYSNFQNKDPIKVMELLSSDFACEEKCKLDLGMRFSVLGILIPYEEAEEVVKELAQKYKMTIQLSD